MEKKIQFNIVGAGRLGKAIAWALTRNDLAELNAVVNTTIDSSQTAVDKLEQGIPTDTIGNLPPADLIFITSPDDTIPSVVEQLIAKKQATVVVHCSGVLNSTILQPLVAQGCSIASFHPLRAFRADYLNQQIFENCYCIIEGDEAACSMIASLFNPLGSNLISIPLQNKALYHAAAVIASNYLVTLADSAITLFEQAGIDAPSARQMTFDLMKSSFENIKNAPSTTRALTGPLMRGDFDTIHRHLDALASNPTILKLYQSAALASLPLTSLDESKKMKFLTLIASYTIKF